MAKLDTALFDIGRLDALAEQDTPLHRLDPRIKLLTTLIFILTVVSFQKYEISGLAPLALYPVILVALGNLPIGYLLKKMLLVAPFAFFMGIFNPILDREILMRLGTLEISGGWISFASIMIRFTLTVAAALILIALTGMNGICLAMGRLGAPRVFTVQLLFLYRYIFVLTEEAARLVRAQSLRSFNARGRSMRLFGYMIGQLLLRTLDRAQRIHQAMLCRGFDGEIRVRRPLAVRRTDVAFILAWSGFFAVARLYNLPQLLGGALTGLIR